MQTGDETHFPPRDQGPVRRYVRDMVDGRRLLTEFFLPVMIGILALSLLPIPALVQTITLVWLAAIALVFAELTWLGTEAAQGRRRALRRPGHQGQRHVRGHPGDPASPPAPAEAGHQAGTAAPPLRPLGHVRARSPARRARSPRPARTCRSRWLMSGTWSFDTSAVPA
jgi:hypothetical protein